MNLEEVIEKLKARQQERVRLCLVRSVAANKEHVDEYRLYEYNDLLGLTKLKRGLCKRDEIDSVLIYAAEDLREKLNGNRMIPAIEELRYYYRRSLDKGDMITLKSYNEYYPMLGLCFDEKFLVLTNYLLTRSRVSGELKKDVAELAKRVIECSASMVPVRGISGPLVSEKEYNGLCRHTLKTIKRYEKEVKREEKIKKKGGIK